MKYKAEICQTRHILGWGIQFFENIIFWPTNGGNEIKRVPKLVTWAEFLQELVALQESNEEIHFLKHSNIPKYIAPVEKPNKEESIVAM